MANIKTISNRLKHMKEVNTAESLAYCRGMAFALAELGYEIIWNEAGVTVMKSSMYKALMDATEEYYSGSVEDPIKLILVERELKESGADMKVIEKEEDKYAHC